MLPCIKPPRSGAAGTWGLHSHLAFVQQQVTGLTSQADGECEDLSEDLNAHGCKDDGDCGRVPAAQQGMLWQLWALADSARRMTKHLQQHVRYGEKAKDTPVMPCFGALILPVDVCGDCKRDQPAYVAAHRHRHVEGQHVRARVPFPTAFEQP